MTSQIVSSTIDADYPVAGQDNDSQGFRDNFSIIKDGLATAAAEVTVLQTNTAKLNEDNDFQGNVIANAQTNRLYGTVYNTSSTSTTNVSLNDGEYQTITVMGNDTLTFVDWPEIDRYAKIRLALKSNGIERTVTFATEGGGVVRTEMSSASTAEANNVNRKGSATATSTVTFSFFNEDLTIGEFQIGDVLSGSSGITGAMTASSVTTLSSASYGTNAAYTLPYTQINGVGEVRIDVSTANLENYTKVMFSDTTGIRALTSTADVAASGGTLTLSDAEYYIYAKSASGFKIAKTYEEAVAGETNIPGLSGTLNYSNIDVSLSSFVKVEGTFEDVIPTGNSVTLSEVTGLTGLSTSVQYYVHGATSTYFYLAASYEDAIAGVNITGVTGPYTGTGGEAVHFGFFIDPAGQTSIYPVLNGAAGSNMIKFASVTGFYEGMPVVFESSIGGIVAGNLYYVTEVVNDTVKGIRVSSVYPALTRQNVSLTTSSDSIAIKPLTVITAALTSSQTIVDASDFTLVSTRTLFPTPFAVNSNVNQIKIVEAWTSDGGSNIFIKYLGEYA